MTYRQNAAVKTLKLSHNRFIITYIIEFYNRFSKKLSEFKRDFTKWQKALAKDKVLWYNVIWIIM